jgi:hypothetical protein
MIKIDSDDKKLKTMSAKLTFLKTFPISEIDNKDIQLICKSYRNDNSSLLSCLVFLDKHEDYLYNWYQNNHMCNVFYNRK